MPLGRAFAVLIGITAVISLLGWVVYTKIMPRFQPEPEPVVVQPTQAPAPPPPPKPRVPQPGELAAEFKRTHANKATAQGVILEESIAETADLRSVEYCTSQDLWFRVDGTHDGKAFLFSTPRGIAAPSNPTAWHRSVVDPVTQWKELAAQEVARIEAAVAQAAMKVKEAEEQIELARKGIVILNAPEEIRKTATGLLWVFPSEPSRQRRILEIKTKVLPKLEQAQRGREAALKQMRDRGIIVPSLRVSDLAISKAGRLVSDDGKPLEATVSRVLDPKTAVVQVDRLTTILEGDASGLADGAKVTLPPVQVVGTRLHQGTVVFRLVRVAIPKLEPGN